MIALRPKANCKGCSYVCFPCPKGTWRMKRVWKGLKVCAMLYELQLSLLEGWQEPVGEKQIQELRWVKICCLSRGKWEGVCSDEGSELGVFSLSHPHHSADPSQLFPGTAVMWLHFDLGAWQASFGSGNLSRAFLHHCSQAACVCFKQSEIIPWNTCNYWKSGAVVPTGVCLEAWKKHNKFIISLYSS